MAIPSPFPISPVLTAIAVGYRNKKLIADRIFPRINVGNAEFKYLSFPIGESYANIDTLVGRKGRPQQVEFTAREINVSVNDYALEDVIPYRDFLIAQAQQAANLSAYDPEERAIIGLSDLLDLSREVRAAQTAFNPANLPASNIVTLSGAAKFSNYTTCDPINVLSTAQNSLMGYFGNCMAMGRKDWQNLRRSTRLVSSQRGFAATDAYLKEEEFKEIFGLDELIIGEPLVNIAAKGQDAQFTRVWDNNILVFYKDPLAFSSPTDGRISFGITGSWGGKVAGSWEDKTVGARGGFCFRVVDPVVELTPAPWLGYLIQGVSY